ncbi:MAG: GNAT family N-acetyltransferase [Bdellovibrionales bacterium]|nr:GNAT family N-acetyltransferase [Bdellovibrionales bacterium]
MYLEILSYTQNKAQRLQDLENIFFSNAQASIENEPERKSLFNKYAKPYIEHWPDDVFFACDLNTNKTMGYLIGCRDSLKAEPILSPLLGSYDLFADQFEKFPAHLHMNTHPEFHSQGVGTFLVQEYIIELKKSGCKGVHIVTAPGLRNVAFYTKNKFTHTINRDYKTHKLLFMGRSL